MISFSRISKENLAGSQLGTSTVQKKAKVSTKTLPKPNVSPTRLNQTKNLLIVLLFARRSLG